MSDIDAALATYTPLASSGRQAELGDAAAELIAGRTKSASVADPNVLAELLALAADPSSLIGESK